MQLRFREIILTIFLSIGLNAMAQFDIPDKPSLQKGVYNYNNLLNQGQEQALNQKLITYADTTSTQIVVAIINSTQGEDISLLGAQWGQKWGIGQAKEDNGILIILAKNDRKVDINTGYGIESIISDRDAKRVIERIMIPQFKQGNYYAGLNRGIDTLIQMLEGNFQGIPSGKNTSATNLKPIILFIVFILILILLNRGNRGGRGGGRRTADTILDTIILSNMGQWWRFWRWLRRWRFWRWWCLRRMVIIIVHKHVKNLEGIVLYPVFFSCENPSYLYNPKQSYAPIFTFLMLCRYFSFLR